MILAEKMFKELCCEEEKNEKKSGIERKVEKTKLKLTFVKTYLFFCYDVKCEAEIRIC